MWEMLYLGTGIVMCRRITTDSMSDSSSVHGGHSALGTGERLLTYVKTIQTRSNIVRCFQRIAFYLTREVSPPDPNHSDVPRATGRM